MLFYYLNGMVSELGPNLAVIDCGGVGFECSVTSYTLSQLQVGETVKLYTFCSAKENSFDIVGFSTKDEKRCFEMLIGINGVGPKAALAILSVCSPAQFRLAVAGGDEKSLTRAPGIGKKVAQRILLELKDKVTLDTGDASLYNQKASFSNSPAQNEAVAALSALGYSQSEISQCLRGINPDGLSTEDIVRQALRAMVMKV